MEYNQTSYGRVAEALMPGFGANASASGLTLVQFNLSGAVNTQLFGVESDFQSWLDLSAVADLAAMSTSGWSAHMLRSKPLTVRKSGTSFVLTSAPGDSVVSNNKRAMGRINLGALGVSFGETPLDLLHDAITGGVPTVSASARIDTSRTRRLAISASGESIIDRFLRKISYRMMRGEPLIGVGIDRGLDCSLDSFSECMVDGPIGQYYEPYLRSFRRQLDQIQKPGLKYVSVAIVGDVSNQKFSALAGAFPDQFNSTDVVFIGIPVVDDSRSEVSNIYFDVTKNKLFMAPSFDIRYVTGKPGSAPNAAMMADILGGTGYVNSDGTTILYTAIPVGNYSSNNAVFGKNYLMFLAPPLDAQHYLFNSKTVTEETLTLNGETILLKKINVDVVMFCCKLSKSWYNDYYVTGFGLFKPRNSNIQTNVLKSWNELQFNEFGICVDPAMSTVSPKIVDETDLAVAYKRSRKKACKDDDWDNILYNTKITNGALKGLIQNSPKLKAFYCVDSIGTEPVFSAPELFTSSWSRTVVGQVVSYVRTDGGTSETYALNETTRDLLLVELSQGATLKTTMASVASDFNLSSEELAGAIDSQEMVADPQLTRQKQLDGIALTPQYFTPDVALSNSGYPAARFMASPYKEAMIMKTYGDLKRFGDPLLRVIESFTGDAIIAKVLSK